MSKPSIIPFDPRTPLEAWDDFPPEDIVSGSRKQNGAILFEDKARGLTAGVWEQAANESRWLDYPVNEFMVVLEGEVVIVEEDRSVSIKAGESFIIPKGLRCRWTQPGHVRKFFVIHDDPACPPVAGPLRTIKIDPKVALEPSTPPPPEMLLAGNPVQNNHLYYADATASSPSASGTRPVTPGSPFPSRATNSCTSSTAR